VLLNLDFELRYLLGDTPWDSGITPPELLAYMDQHPTGNALEFGCGTGTNAIALSLRGWRVDAVDVSWVALAKAWLKIRRSGAQVQLLHDDVTQVGQHHRLHPPYSLALDIGCFHALDKEGRQAYGSQLPALVEPGGGYLLYSFLKQGQSTRRNWPQEAEILSLHQADFELVSLEHGTYGERPSAWFTFRRSS
jgi:cyclopropane fatty-acyl-phospholipid synthase-like methyltransferase